MLLERVMIQHTWVIGRMSGSISVDDGNANKQRNVPKANKDKIA